MSRSAWKIENYTYRECPHPMREFKYAVSLHNHSCHSVEKLAALNQVVKLGFMRPLSGVLQRSFGLEDVSGLNYAEITFNPPYTPEAVYQMESSAAALWGFDGVHLTITDHDEFAGGLALLRGRPDLKGQVAIGEEVSVWYQGHLFHLGVSGLPEDGIDELHTRIQAAARGGRHDELFETLAASGCLVVLNHYCRSDGRPCGAVRHAQLFCSAQLEAFPAGLIFHVALPADCQLQGTTGGRDARRSPSLARSRRSCQ
ncbi:MAG: hypothetical protein ABSE44_13970 [Candidatus Sulfotelmatobacter sp.]